MENMPQVLKDIRARRNAEITFGYVLKDGTYTTVRGIVESFRGSKEHGITGIKVRYTGQHAHHFTKWIDEHGRYIVPFGVAGIEAGEKVRAARKAEKQRAERDAYRAANRATTKQVAYLERLYREAGQELPAELGEISKLEASERISGLEDILAPKRAARGRCQGCGGPLNPHGLLDGLRSQGGYCYDCI